MGEGENGYDELSLIEEAEAEAIAATGSSKRQKLFAATSGDNGPPENQEEGSCMATESSKRPKLSAATSGDGGMPENQEEGSYMAALRGSRSSLWQRQQYELGLQKKGVDTSGLGSGNSSTDSSLSKASDVCFKCGMTGHWARDCGGGQGGFVNRTDGSAPAKPCPCGSGTCLVLTSNTSKNPGRMFYRCPLQAEMGGCNYFEWCNSQSSGCTFSGIALDGQSKPEAPVLLCPCGAGSCLVVVAKIGKNAGQQYYRCPKNEESVCGFFKWCDEPHSVSRQSSVSQQFHGLNQSSSAGSGLTSDSCFKCGQEGHWAKDCQNQPSKSSDGKIKPSSMSSGLTSGSCFKCGEPGHWARDCPTKKYSTVASIKRK